jgi:hypothetical protein
MRPPERDHVVHLKLPQPREASEDQTTTFVADQRHNYEWVHS